jgi:hypothetical protein
VLHGEPALVAGLASVGLASLSSSFLSPLSVVLSSPGCCREQHHDWKISVSVVHGDCT